MKSHVYIKIIDCWHCPYHYKSTRGMRRCAWSGREFDNQDGYNIPDWCELSEDPK